MAAANGHLAIVKRLLRIPDVEYNISVEDNRILKGAVENNHPRVAHLLASVQWPGGVKDMPKSLQKECLAVIQEGARLSSSEKVVRGVLVSAYLGKGTSSPCLFSLPEGPLFKIAEYVGIDRPLDEQNDQAHTVSLNKALFL